MLLQWSCRSVGKEAEEKKGGVSPLKTAEIERVRDLRIRARACLSVCPLGARTSLLHSDWHWGRGISWVSDLGGRPDQVTLIQTMEGCPSLSHLSLPGNVSAESSNQQLISDCEGPSCCLRTVGAGRGGWGAESMPVWVRPGQGRHPGHGRNQGRLWPLGGWRVESQE